MSVIKREDPKQSLRLDGVSILIQSTSDGPSQKVVSGALSLILLGHVFLSLRGASWQWQEAQATVRQSWA